MAPGTLYLFCLSLDSARVPRGVRGEGSTNPVQNRVRGAQVNAGDDLRGTGNGERGTVTGTENVEREKRENVLRQGSIVSN